MEIPWLFDLCICNTDTVTSRVVVPDLPELLGMKERWITKEDFQKAKKALEEANVPGPYWIPLEQLTKPVQEFSGGESYPTSLDNKNA